VYICPHCHKPGLSFYRRMFLGPVSAATCRVCGGKVGVSWGRSMAVMVPFAVAIMAIAEFLPDAPVVSFSVMGLAAVVVCLAFLRFVPLIKKQ
jgi:hypothetical protein